MGTRLISKYSGRHLEKDRKTDRKIGDFPNTEGVLNGITLEQREKLITIAD
jgi:hypothetical protein